MINEYYINANQFIQKIILDETCCEDQKLATLISLGETIENGLDFLISKRKTKNTNI